MNISEVLLQDFDTEVSNTRRTLERVPADKKDWTPHAKSMPLGKLAMHCATILQFGAYILEDDGMDMAAPKHPHVPLVFTTPEQTLQHLAESASACRANLASASDEHMLQDWPFRFSDQLISSTTRLLSFRQLCFDHLIHHTSQLGVYLRLLDVPVPALYGPSADEQWTPK